MNEIPTFPSWSSQTRGETDIPTISANVTRSLERWKNCALGIREKSDELIQRVLGRTSTEGVAWESSEGVGIYRKMEVK